MGETASQPEGSKEFVTSRVFDAPRDRVWAAMTEAERMKEWWGPTGFSVFAAQMDFRVGGTFLCGMRSLEGFKLWGKFTYREIAAPERLVFINAFSNESGSVIRHPIIPTWPLETRTSVFFEAEPGGKTKLTVHWVPHNASEAERKTFSSSHVALRATWASTFDQLAAYLARS